MVSRVSGSKMTLNHAARVAGIAMFSLTLMCGATGIGAAWVQRAALEEQTEAAALFANHELADMMHDAVRADVLAAFESLDPASGLQRADIEKDFAEHIAELKRGIAADDAYEGSPELEAVTSKLAEPMEAYAAAAHDIIGETGRDPVAAKAQLPGFFDKFRVLEDSMAKASDAINANSQKLSGRASWIGGVAIAVLATTLLLGIAGAWFLVIQMRKRVVQPIQDLAATMLQLGEGDLTAEVHGADRGDELGDMARAMESFRDQLAAKEAAKQAQTQLIVESIGTGLERLATGDLTVAIHADLQGPFAGLKKSFATTVAGLHELIGAVMTGSDAIETGSNEIARASEDLARRTEANAANLEETSAAVTQMDGRLKATAAAASRTVGRADSAIATVSGGRNVADEAMQAMNRVSESAQGIDAVIEGLDKIAFQTRVLAMNAAVEAGRAGEAGRGFAVVADLVSALAMRAEEEAKSARDQLTVTQQDIETAVTAVQKVDTALQDISSEVNEVHGLLGEIAADNQAQASTVTEISAAIANMDRSTQQNAAMVEETSAAARSLMIEVETLGSRARQFTIEPASGHQAPVRQPAAVQPTYH